MVADGVLELGVKSISGCAQKPDAGVFERHGLYRTVVNLYRSNINDNRHILDVETPLTGAAYGSKELLSMPGGFYIDGRTAAVSNACA